MQQAPVGARRERRFTFCCYAVIMANLPKRKATFYISEDVLRAARVSAARTDRRDSEVVEKALREHLGFDVLERVWAHSELSEKEAMDLVVSEGHAARRREPAPRRPCCQRPHLGPADSA